MNIEKFNEECSVVNLGFEYPGMTGGVKWAVITDLDKSVLEERYGDALMPYKPYVIMSVEQGQAFREYELNEKKHDMRQLRHHDYQGYEEGTTEYMHSVFSSDEPEDMVISKMEYEVLRETIDKLPEKQKKRCKLYFYYGFSEAEIARIEGVSQKNISTALSAAIKNLKKVLENRV
ncbi:sigma-70 family RNA polymerase sigma factor [Butyrivibrio sp. INlla16]|uniref:sigma-70 family RNA polymerase sigma factor n=1 Tax=Butyrivibrio sp. INlla16 TaxID=1520807 RepID=UPI0008845CB0|nr:sigma-70 family RNA polymerase sigma factor [Butyrivibrio sp. INlla16]SDB03935.1 RNA polymerase sigma factor, sigma-70 family [Butyrivibrio sp. INlla16]